MSEMTFVEIQDQLYEILSDYKAQNIDSEQCLRECNDTVLQYIYQIERDRTK